MTHACKLPTATGIQIVITTAIVIDFVLMAIKTKSITIAVVITIWIPVAVGSLQAWVISL